MNYLFLFSALGRETHFFRPYTFYMKVSDVLIWMNIFIIVDLINFYLNFKLFSPSTTHVTCR